MESNIKNKWEKNEENKIIIKTDNIEQNETNSPLLNLPDYLIEKLYISLFNMEGIIFLIKGAKRIIKMKIKMMEEIIKII